MSGQGILGFDDAVYIKVFRGLKSSTYRNCVGPHPYKPSFANISTLVRVSHPEIVHVSI